MAFPIAAVFILSLLFRPSFLLPVSLDVKTVQLFNSEMQYSDKTPVVNTESIFNHENEVKLVQSLSTETVLNAFESFEAAHGKRIKRNIVKPKWLCPDDRIQVGNKCMTPKEYDEYNDIGEGSDDYVAER